MKTIRRELLAPTLAVLFVSTALLHADPRIKWTTYKPFDQSKNIRIAQENLEVAKTDPGRNGICWAYALLWCDLILTNAELANASDQSAGMRALLYTNTDATKSINASYSQMVGLSQEMGVTTDAYGATPQIRIDRRIAHLEAPTSFSTSRHKRKARRELSGEATNPKNFADAIQKTWAAKKEPLVYLVTFKSSSGRNTDRFVEFTSSDRQKVVIRMHNGKPLGPDEAFWRTDRNGNPKWDLKNERHANHAIAFAVIPQANGQPYTYFFDPNIGEKVYQGFSPSIITQGLNDSATVVGSPNHYFVGYTAFDARNLSTKSSTSAPPKPPKPGTVIRKLQVLFAAYPEGWSPVKQGTWQADARNNSYYFGGTTTKGVQVKWYPISAEVDRNGKPLPAGNWGIENQEWSWRKR